MDSGRRSGMTLSRRRKTRVIKSTRKVLPAVDINISIRPLSRRVESRNPQLSIKSKSHVKRPKTKKMVQSRRPRSKSGQRKQGKYGPTDPMISTCLSSLDLDELRELERVFLDNQCHLRRSVLQLSVSCSYILRSSITHHSRSCICILRYAYHISYCIDCVKVGLLLLMPPG